MPDDQQQGGNPAARSGLNYSDIGGNVGISADNVYYFDGIDVTDRVTGTFGANLNTEIIQEQHVITGAIPAEFVGAPGLISTVITKSGNNSLHGSANYFFQNDNLVAENEHASAETFSTKDSAFTVGGPVYRDKAWFFGSYRYLNREDDVSTLDTQRVHAHGRQHAAPGLRQGQLGGDQRRPSELHVPQRPDRRLGPPPARHHQRARPRPRAGRQPLQRHLHPRVGRDAARSQRQQAQRRSDRPLGDPRVAQRRPVPDRRRARADRRAGWRLRPRPDRPARQQGAPRIAAALVEEPHLQGRP